MERSGTIGLEGGSIPDFTVFPIKGDSITIYLAVSFRAQFFPIFFVINLLQRSLRVIFQMVNVVGNL